MTNDQIKIKQLEEMIEHLQFRQQLLFDNNEVSRLLFEYDITKQQHNDIMDLMDEYRRKIGNNEKVSHAMFEGDMYKIIPSKYGDYHMCEYITKAFMNAGSWDEVFPKLYGNLSKYN